MKVVYKCEYACSESGFADWQWFRSYDNLEEAIKDLAIAQEEHQYLAHRVVKVEYIETDVELITIDAQADFFKETRDEY